MGANLPPKVGQPSAAAPSGEPPAAQRATGRLETLPPAIAAHIVSFIPTKDLPALSQIEGVAQAVMQKAIASDAERVNKKMGAILARLPRGTKAVMERHPVGAGPVGQIKAARVKELAVTKTLESALKNKNFVQLEGLLRDNPALVRHLNEMIRVKPEIIGELDAWVAEEPQVQAQKNVTNLLIQSGNLLLAVLKGTDEQVEELVQRPEVKTSLQKALQENAMMLVFTLDEKNPPKKTKTTFRSRC